MQYMKVMRILTACQTKQLNQDFNSKYTKQIYNANGKNYEYGRKSVLIFKLLQSCKSKNVHCAILIFVLCSPNVSTYFYQICSPKLPTETKAWIDRQCCWFIFIIYLVSAHGIPKNFNATKNDMKKNMVYKVHIFQLRLYHFYRFQSKIHKSNFCDETNINNVIR